MRSPVPPPTPAPTAGPTPPVPSSAVAVAGVAAAPAAPAARPVAPSAATAATAPATVRVWDPVVRSFHWSLVASFAGAWWAAEGSPDAHLRLGYAALALVLLRIVWGFVARGAARFDHFVPGPAALRDHLRERLQGRAPRHLGHNPAGAVMILALLAAVIGLGGTGWMMGTDAFWGAAWLETLHAGLAQATLLAVGLHVGAALLESWQHRENLVLALLSGRKRAPGPGDRPHLRPVPRAGRRRHPD